MSSCSEIEFESSDSEEGSLIDRLLTVTTIGTGTFGRVQLCRHKINGKYYALKSMNIKHLIENRQVDHVYNEKKILSSTCHPFIVRLYDTYKDKLNLNMVMEFLPGGELFSYLRSMKTFSSPMAKFYAAEITLALGYLHESSIAYRDLKPENLILDHEGHIKLTDFGFAKRILDKSYTTCGTTEYLAPEIIEHVGHNMSVDWWALGILIFEMMSGDPPFPGENVKEFYEHIKGYEVMVFPPKIFSANAKNIISKLLIKNPKERLGCGKNDAKDIKNHPWFSTYDWDLLLQKGIPPPVIPTLYPVAGNFDSYNDEDNFVNEKPSQTDLALFKDW
uniref:Protein kinase domain-containing protein n=1 Tax=Parastrongyloides trichosuri TaxID=131310 RepID=A0A0N4ZS67_PARTI